MYRQYIGGYNRYKIPASEQIHIYIWIELLQYKQLRTPRRDALICVHTSLQIQPTVWAGIGRCYSPQTKSSSSYIRKNSVILLQMWRCANIVLTKFSVELLLNSPLKLPHLMPDGIYCQPSPRKVTCCLYIIEVVAETELNSLCELISTHHFSICFQFQIIYQHTYGRKASHILAMQILVCVCVKCRWEL